MITDISPDIKLTIIDPKNIDNMNDDYSDINVILAWGQQNLDFFLPKVPNLKWIQTFSAGVEQILTSDIVKRGIPVSNTKGIHGVPISEYIFANLLSYYRKLPEMKENQKQKIWKKVTGDELFNKTIGIIGFGAIGREIAKKGKAFGMEVLASKRHKTEELFIDELYGDHELGEILPLCDIVVLSLPLTPETHHLFDAEKFKWMKKGSCLVNISRGNILVEKDLINALDVGEIGHAILDVFEEEPLPQNSPFWTLKNVTLTPHISASTPYYMDRAIHVFTKNLERFLHEKSLTNVIDPKIGY